MVSFGDNRSGEEVTLRSKCSIAASSEVDIFVEELDEIVEGFVLAYAGSTVVNDSEPESLGGSGLGVKCWLLNGGLVFCLDVRYGFLDVFLSINKLTLALSLSLGLIFRVLEPRFVGSLGYPLVSG